VCWHAAPGQDNNDTVNSATTHAEEPAACSPFAAALRLAREARGWTIDDVARRCLLSDLQIIGLERDDFRAFYGHSYAVQAAIRCSALLAVDRNLPGFPGTAADLPAAQAPAAAIPVDSVAEPGQRPSPRHETGHGTGPGARQVWLALAGVVAVLAMGWWLHSRQDVAEVELPLVAASEAETVPVPAAASGPAEGAVAEEAPQPVQAEPAQQPLPPPTVPQPTPVVADVPPASAPPSGVTADRGRSPTRFHVHAVAAVGLKATDATGKVLFSGSLEAGARRNLTGKPPFTVETSTDPDDLEIFHLGQRKRPTGAGTATVTFGEAPGVP
jgi:cytoskeleton protein RodZ